MPGKYRRILYLGEARGSSLHRANALRRLGHEVTVVWPERLIGNNRVLAKWAWHTGGLFLDQAVSRRLLAMNVRADFVLVNSGELVGPSLVADLKKKFGPVINLNADDPFGGRDGRRWRLYLQAVPIYDMVCVVRNVNVEEARAHGARNVMRLFMSADEVAHAPMTPGERAERRWKHEVSFIGTWMPERGPFFAKIAERGIPLSIYGDRWHRAPEWPVLKRFWRGRSLGGADYRDAIKYSKICIGMLSKGNRDLHTQRSLEIPYIGGLLCAERTSEHLEMYAEGTEAVFWTTAAECADRCRSLLADDGERVRIAANGQRRALTNGHLNEPVMDRIVEAVGNL